MDFILPSRPKVCRANQHSVLAYRHFKMVGPLRLMGIFFTTGRWALLARFLGASFTVQENCCVSTLQQPSFSEPPRLVNDSRTNAG